MANNQEKRSPSRPARPEGFRAGDYAAFSAAVLMTLVLCVCLGSVAVPVKSTLSYLFRAVFSSDTVKDVQKAIIISVRLPRVLCVALTGAMLSLAGAAMQGLLRNPLADGSTLGVSSGASLGAMLAIAFGVNIPGIPLAGTMGMAITFGLLSLFMILALAYRLDRALSTNTIILIGVIFSMFISSLMSLIITFAGERLKTIMFWTMGSLSGASYTDALFLFCALALFGGVLMLCANELNAFSLGENNARYVGVDVKKIKIVVLIAVSGLIGVCVSVGGTIGFVGLTVPHMARMLVGPNHKRLLSACAFSGAVFLMLSDLISRTILSPLELPVGVVTSLIGSVVFVWIFKISRRKA